MNTNADHDQGADSDDLDALLRRVDATAERALAQDLDVEERLAWLKSAEAASDRELAEVMTRWSVELLADASRGAGTLIRPVDDTAFFAAAVGRERAGLEPWPEMEVRLTDATPQAIAMALSLPGLAQGARVTATIRVASWADRTELLPPASGSRDANDTETEVSGTIVLPETVTLESLSGMVIELRVEDQ